MYTRHVKEVKFVGSSLEDLKGFPADPRRESGREIYRVQKGLEPTNWKPIKTVGAGAKEIRTKDKDGIYRVIYVANFDDTVYVLHSFGKKTQKTSQSDINIAKERYREVKRTVVKEKAKTRKKK